MDFRKDERVILTLDAGGTNFDFNAVKGGEPVTNGIRLPAAAQHLDEILKMIIKGFEAVREQAGTTPSGISFCFPGPADYRNGIIGDLANLPLFRGGVPLKAMLENHFGIPVYINNDGDLFAYGEAIAGLLPEVNNTLATAGSPRVYRNLLGVTFGTGYGGGIVWNGELFTGDNSAGAEINRMRNKLYPLTSAEDSVSIRGVRRVFAREAGLSFDEAPVPEEIFNIGIGKAAGDKAAAIKAFGELAEVAGDTIANSVTLTDSLVVIGGGLAGAWPLFMERLVGEMNRSFEVMEGSLLPRLEISAYNLEDQKDLGEFVKNTSIKVKVPFTALTADYDPVKKVGVGISRLGTSRAVAIGAYAYALNELSGR
ncbi:MAG TPA: ROK family protein [Bacteroidales bacterium]|nr:ROK family protein [Bacteroidales bacterium]